ncbi:MAG: hypothetical protein ACI4M6_01505 [Christensenellaceae bacterium]
MLNLLSQITPPSSQPVKNPPVGDIYLFFVLFLFVLIAVEIVLLTIVCVKTKKLADAKHFALFPPVVAMLLPLNAVKAIIIAEVVTVAVLYIVLRVAYAKLTKLSSEKNKKVFLKKG